MDFRRAAKLQQPTKPLCPNCKSEQDGFTAAEAGAKPKDGSISVCIYCQHINMFQLRAGELVLIPAPYEVIEELKADPGTWAAVEKAITWSKKIIEEKQKIAN